jgi:hypothetical protein
LLYVFSILKIGVELDDGMSFLKIVPNCPRFLDVPKRIKFEGFYFPRLLLDGQH